MQFIFIEKFMFRYAEYKKVDSGKLQTFKF